MPSSKNPFTILDVPHEIIELAAKKPGIICNLRLNQQPDLTNETKDKQSLRNIQMVLFDTKNLYEKMETFLKDIQPGTRIILVCQGFGEDIFTFVTDVTNIYWADKYYPRIDFEKRPRVVRQIFGHSNLWGGFILAAAKVGRVKKQADLGYELLLNLAERNGGIKFP